MKANYPQLSYRKHTFLSGLVAGLSGVIITLIICATIIIIYAMNLAGDKSEEVISLVRSTIQGLPAIRSSLPPIAADVLNDRRDPDYSSQVEIRAEPAFLPQDNSRLGAAVTILNKGAKVISLMSLRIAILNNKNDILAQLNEWVATPVAGENDWPGPLLPNSRRYFSVQGKNVFNMPNLSDLKAEVEITDIRTWNGQKSLAPGDVNEPSAVQEM